MQEFITIMSEPWAIRALIASSLVGIMCGALGCFIVLRNMSLIGDALAHAILPGVFVAFLLLGYSTIGIFFGSVAAGLIAAFGITWIQQNANTKNDAAIGIIFTSMFSLGVIGISYLNKRPGVHFDLKDILFGTILGVSDQDLYLTLGVCLYCLVSIVIFYRYLFATTFQSTIARTMGMPVKYIHYFLMLLLSFAVVSSLRTVGVILVVAMLITPAATALLLSNKLKNVILISSVLGLVSAISGFVVAVLLDTTPGPAMCIMATLYYFLAVIFSPQKGLVIKYWRKQEQKHKIDREDIIKYLFKNQNSSLSEIGKALEISNGNMSSNVNKLRTTGLLTGSNDQLHLTAKGSQAAQELVRAHRLWETYLVDKLGMKEGQIHPEAEKYEHLLTDDILDEVDKSLGYPDKDPHGSPIPPKIIKPTRSLLSLNPKQIAKIARNQINDWVESELWELGLAPDQSFKVSSIKANVVIIEANSIRKTIPASLAKQINVDI